MMEWEVESLETKSAGQEFIDRLRKIDDPAAIIVTTHLFCENALNELMKAKKKTPGQFIKEDSAFVVKLDLCFNMGLISEELFINLNKLNKLRNKCAHKVHVDFTTIDHNYNMFNTEGKIDKLPTIKDKLVMIGVVTYGPLHNHLNSMGIRL